MRRPPRLAENLVHELMRHLVAEHLDDDCPGLSEDHRARELEDADVSSPAAEVRRRAGENDGRNGEGGAEVRRVDPLPLGDELPEEGALERSGELLVLRLRR